MRLPNQHSGVIRTAQTCLRSFSNDLGIRYSQASLLHQFIHSQTPTLSSQSQRSFPFGRIQLPELPSSDWCCDEGSNPIQNPENCRQLVFGRFGICLRLRWRCTNGMEACTSRISTFQSITS